MRESPTPASQQHEEEAVEATRRSPGRRLEHFDMQSRQKGQLRRSERREWKTRKSINTHEEARGHFTDLSFNPSLCNPFETNPNNYGRNIDTILNHLSTLDLPIQMLTYL